MPALQPLRPQELVLAIGMASMEEVVSVRDLQAMANASSTSRIHESLARLRGAGLIGQASGRVMKRALFAVLRESVRWMVPADLGDEVLGVPTAHSIGPLADELQWSRAFVWPAREGHAGEILGQSVEPLHSWAYGFAESLPAAHVLLALADSIRVGRARDRELARGHLAAALLSQ